MRMFRTRSSHDDLTPDQVKPSSLFTQPVLGAVSGCRVREDSIILTMLRRLIVDEHYLGKILIIAPIRVATRVWPQEPSLWTHLCWMRPLVLRVEDDDPRLLALPRSRRTAEKARLRAELVKSPEQIHVIDYHAVDWLVAECAKTRQWPYGWLCLTRAPGFATITASCSRR